MLKNHVKVFWRHITRQPLYAFINITGLAVGMAACLLILLYIQDETSYEDMHAERSNIVRVLTIDKAIGTNNQRVGITMPALGPAVPDAFSEIDDATRLTFGGQTLLRYGQNTPIYAEQLRSADANFFDFFDYVLRKGDPGEALREPYSIILTESLAHSIFGDEDPMGKVLTDGDGNDLTVTGVLADLPSNTHLEFDALGSMKTVEATARANQPPNATNPIWIENWNMIAMPTYAKLAGGIPEGVKLDSLEARITRLTYENGVTNNFEIALQPLDDVHLGSTDVIFDPVQNKGDRATVTIFAAIALLILLIAVVNYLNLSTARSTERAREVGMRKVVGSTKSQLVSQFLSESVFTTLVALVIAVVLAWIAVPMLNSVAGSSLQIGGTTLPTIVGFVVASVLGVGLLAGLYPAIALSGFQPISVLKGSFSSSKSGRYVRVGLVITQFSLSIALIGTTWMVQKQLNYIQTKDMGYDREQVMLLDMVDGTMAQNQNLLKENLEANSAFSSVAVSQNVPGRTFGRTGVLPEGVPADDVWIWSVFSAAPETLPTLGIQMAEGRNFDRARPADTTGVALINETAVKLVGWEDPVGKRIYQGSQDSVGIEVIGVMKDFHFAGIHQNVEPLIVYPLASNPGNTLVAKINPGRVPDAVAAAEEAWRSVYPEYPFAYGFMDEEFDQLYARDRVTGFVVNVFSGLAILIACLGLFGLASYSTTQRTKEIGVRKVMGASSTTIVGLLVFDFIRWVVLANVIAWPLAWMASNSWLDNFAYRIDVDPLVLVGASVVAIAIAVGTVLLQTWKAAVMNPAVALRYE